MSLLLRKFENYHILLWLVKDLCWAMEWRLLGVIMIAPTITLAIYIAYKSYADRFDFLHNIAVVCWICANSTWMAGEFYGYELRSFAAIFFISGIGSIAVSYLLRLKEKRGYKN